MARSQRAVQPAQVPPDAGTELTVQEERLAEIFRALGQRSRFALPCHTTSRSSERPGWWNR